MIKALATVGLAWDIKVAKIAQPVAHDANDRIVVEEEAVA
jgi:hypothetical protein